MTICVFIFLSQVSNEPGNRYNIQLINALVLYVGTQAIAHIHNKGSTPSMSTITHSAHMDIFQNLAVDLDTEGKVAAQLAKPLHGFGYFYILTAAFDKSITVWPAFSFSGRYLFLNAIANQLRYPNSHTHYFSCTMLYLFAEANTEAIQEQITRWDAVDSESLSLFRHRTHGSITKSKFKLFIRTSSSSFPGSCWRGW